MDLPDAIGAILFFGGGLLLSAWIFRTGTRYAGLKIIALWIWLFGVNASGCHTGSQNQISDLASMPTSSALREIAHERERLRQKYGDDVIEKRLREWAERQNS